jgi:short-subunit dehydrogenase
VDVLINNAGFGPHIAFLEIPWERERAMLDLDIVTLTHLTKLFVTDMVGRRFGYVLPVASIGAYQPSPTNATYSAARAMCSSSARRHIMSCATPASP